MDLAARKYHFIEELLKLENESILEKLEKILKKEKDSKLPEPAFHRETLKIRMDEYKNNPDNILDWEDVKNEW